MNKNKNLIAISGKINSGKDTVGQIINYLLFVKETEIDLNTPDRDFWLTISFEDFNKQFLPLKAYKIKKFADKLKDIVCILLGCTREQLEDRDFKEKELGEEWWYYKEYNSGLQHPKYTPLILYNEGNKKVFGQIGSIELVKLTPRLLLTLLGTECGRQIIHPNIWVNALFADYKPKEGIWKNLIKSSELGFVAPEIGSDVYLNYCPNWIITDLRFPNELKTIQDRNGITIRVNREIKHQVESLGGRTNIETGYFPTNQHESETALDNVTDWDYVIDNNSTLENLIEKVKDILIIEKII